MQTPLMAVVGVHWCAGFIAGLRIFRVFSPYRDPVLPSSRFSRSSSFFLSSPFSLFPSSAHSLPRRRSRFPIALGRVLESITLAFPSS